MYHSFKDQILIEVRSLFSGYPDFVYSKNDNLILDGIPVFVYHTIDPKLFESQLQYLKDNGYRTLSIHEFYETMVDSKTFDNKKTVLITIDDARSSVWRYAYPLLKKYEMHASVFVIPGITQESILFRKNLEDFWNDKCSLKEIYNEDENDNTLCNWQEIKEMYSSGFVNIESHTLFHREIFKNLNITDYIIPEISFIPYNFKGSPYYSLDDLGKTMSSNNFGGLPLFESAPLMLAGPKLDISTEFIVKCKEIYLDASKNNKDWKSSIKKIVNEQLSRNKYFSLEPHSKEDVLQDLMISRELIQKNLDSNAGNHLCLPWTKGNNDTINICIDLGIKSCFWGILESKKINKPGDNPYFISRIKNDFIFRLPGKHRKSLYFIYAHKLKRRLSDDKVF
jgi:hypothetical protein